MEDEKHYAILFERKIISGKYDVVCYKPCYTIAGLYDKDNSIFLDELNNERIIMVDSNNMNIDEDFCVGEIISESKLKEKYPSAYNIEEAMIYYNAAAQDFMYIGIYDLISNTIKVIKIDLGSLVQKYGSDNLENKESKENDKTVKSTPRLNSLTEKEKAKASDFYESLKQSLENQDFTMLLNEDMDKLLEMTDINEFRHSLLTLKREKLDYYAKINGKNISEAFIVGDTKINELLKLDSIDELKHCIRELIDTVKGIPATPEDMYEVYNEMNDTIQECITVDEAKEFLQQMREEYETSLQDVEENYEDSDLSSYRSFLKLQIDGISILLSYNDLNEIKDRYQNLYDSSLILLAESTNEVFDEVEVLPEDSKKMTEEDYKELFKTKTDQEIKDSIKEELAKLDELVGLDDVKVMIKRIIARMLFNNKTENILNMEKPNMNMVFTGNPGTGKTTVASIIAPIFHKLGYLTSDKVAIVAAEDLIAGYVGQTAIKTKNVINANKGGLIILDEAYILSGTAQQFGPEALTVILKEMETNRTAFAFLGYAKEMEDFIKMNSGLKSRIKPRNFVEFKDYSTDELLEMFVKLFDKVSIDKTKKLTFGEGVLEKVRKMIDEAKKNVDFGNARYVNSLFQEVIDEHALNVEDATSIEELLTISLKDIPERKEKVKTKLGFC